MIKQIEPTTDYNLYDIMPVEKISKRNSAGTKKLVDDILEKMNQLQMINDMIMRYESVSLLNPSSKNSNYGKFVSKIKEDIDNDRKNFYEEKGFLPPEIDFSHSFEVSEYYNKITLKKVKDTLSKIAASPKITLGQTKDLVNKLDMILVPMDYLDLRSINSETYKKQAMIKKFNSELSKENFDIYVLSPLNHYSLKTHVEHNNPNKFIYSGKHASIFTNIMMNLPLFRTILNELNSLREDVENIKGTISNVKENIKMMQEQINNLQSQINQQREEQILLKLKQSEDYKKLQKELSDVRFDLTDPVLIAFPKGLNINDNKNNDKYGIVGPTWGPDFKGAALFDLDLTIIKNQRNTLDKTISRIWDQNQIN